MNIELNDEEVGVINAHLSYLAHLDFDALEEAFPNVIDIDELSDTIDTLCDLMDDGERVITVDHQDKLTVLMACATAPIKYSMVKDKATEQLDEIFTAFIKTQLDIQEKLSNITLAK